MDGFSELIQQGAGNAWLFIPSAILLGALHGLEPGHSKTMMAAFIIAIRGTVAQAVMLGIAATISHTIVVWAIALTGMYLYQGLDADTVEPYLQLVSGAVIVAMALWMIQRTYQDQQAAKEVEGQHHDHDHGHSHDHDHDHAHPHAADENIRKIDTGHGLHKLVLNEDSTGAHWRFSPERGKPWTAGEVSLKTERPDGREQTFTFAEKAGYIESVEAVPEPHDFMVRLVLGHKDHSHDFDVSFLQSTEGSDHAHEDLQGLALGAAGYQNAHELAHARDIRKRFSGERTVTNWQIVLFGLTGGLIPCPAAITVLLLCLQLKEIPLGAVLVLCFSIGLAITLVAVGAAAAIGVRHATKRISWFNAAARRAPYFSGALLVVVGLYVAWHGYEGVSDLQAGASVSQTQRT
ncbi:nickel/cobalt efflux transporter [Terrihabitans rhizophilus]|uniref:Nickel/cobalt efflux system n=1 Tax=Terrihabitans rhizophilus TaxID=3092662 RepID=A0ABU4RJN7_9HYPH|nr:nickel/cobalt efflux transporter [Terrihabitans sp. PJ23]MDX6804776.1 nickel/cobalt efflux transporter [Terrihabitans sp. PJ23]